MGQGGGGGNGAGGNPLPEQVPKRTPGSDAGDHNIAGEVDFSLLEEEFAKESTGGVEPAGGDPLESLRSSLNEGDPVIRMKKLLDALEGMNPDNVEWFAEELREFSGPREGQLLSYFVHQWATFDPEGAIEFASSTGGTRQGMWLTTTAIRSWGKNDPQAALDYLEGNDLRQEGFYLPGLLSGWASADPLGAAQYAAGIEDAGLRQRSLSGVARELASTDVEQMKTYLNSMSDAGAREELLSSLTSRLSRSNPEQSLKLLVDMDPDLSNTDAVSELVRGWANEDPSAASEFVMELPEGQTRSEGLEALINQWSRRDPIAAGEWLNQFPPSSELDGAVASYVNRVERSDPEGAMTWAISIADPELRNELMVEVGTRWMVRDVASAQDYLQSSNIPESIRSTIESRFPEQRATGAP